MLHPKFQKLITYFGAVNAAKFDDVQQFYHMISHSEGTSKKRIENEADKYRAFTLTNMVRVYPANRRVLSGNYDPLPHWSVGAQMVALNCQTDDIHLLINRALFALDYKCGWILKPSYLRESSPKVTPGTLNITIHSASLDLQSAPNNGWFHVSVCGYEPNRQYKAKLTENAHGLNPIWLETITLEMSQPELFFLQFNVLSGRNVIVQYTVANRNLSRGFSSIQLETVIKESKTNDKVPTVPMDRGWPEASLPVTGPPEASLPVTVTNEVIATAKLHLIVTDSESTLPNQQI